MHGTIKHYARLTYERVENQTIIWKRKKYIRKEDERMGAPTLKMKVYRAPAGIRVQRMPNDTQGEQTSKSKCFILCCGEFQRPISESFLRNNFKTQDGRTPDPRRIVFDRIYSVCPETEEAMEILTAEILAVASV